MFQFGVERILDEHDLQKKLGDRRIALLAHPASVTKTLAHSIDALSAVRGLKLAAAFGPQHGMRGEKQDNMIESDDYIDPVHKIPVYSLYGTVRRPTPAMMEGWDILLVDLQDVGCRIYTFLTTLFYMMDAMNGTGREIWVLDRPNPAGRDIEGHILDMKYASFVGAAPVPMRHGLTLGEAALWYRAHKKMDLKLNVVAMKGYHPKDVPRYGWPDLTWVNPSPNMPRVSCSRVYPGSVLFEGTNLSEGRGTTIPLEIFGAPKLDVPAIIKDMRAMAPKWVEGCLLRPGFFEPTFHKFKGELVAALQVHVDGPEYNPRLFRPYRLCNLFLKSVHRLHPEVSLWRTPPYEYEETLLPIDMLSGHDQLRGWVEAKDPLVDEWDKSLAKDEEAWDEERAEFLLY